MAADTSEAQPGPDALDFWLGDWACSWDGGHGTNTISREFDGRVLVERFEAFGPERWSGMSLSVHDERLGWRQTWVDSTGNYWAFSEVPHMEGFCFSVTEVDDGREVEKRMVFSDIAHEGFTWRLGALVGWPDVGGPLDDPVPAQQGTGSIGKEPEGERKKPVARASEGS